VTVFFFVIEPLMLKILPKSRNPLAFFNPFSQTLLGILNRCGGLPQMEELSSIAKTYREIVAVCRRAVCVHVDLEDPANLLVACSTSLIFAHPSNPLPLQKAFLCHQDPKWRSSFSRLIHAQGRASNTFERHIFGTDCNPVTQIQEIIVPPLADLEARQARQSIVRLGERLGKEALTGNSLGLYLNGFGYDTLTGQQLLRTAQQGALLIGAFHRYRKMGQEGSTEAHDDESHAPRELVEELLSPSFLEASLFLIMWDDYLLTEGLGRKLLGLASTESNESNRLLMFRSLGCLMAGMEGASARLKMMTSLIKQHPDQPNIKSALVSLLRENLADPSHGLLRDPPSAGPDPHHQADHSILLLRALLFELFDSTPLDLHLINLLWKSRGDDNAACAIAELLTYLIERLNLVYLLLKIDHQNLTGIKQGELHGRVKRVLITGVFEWLEEAAGVVCSDVAGADDRAAQRALNSVASLLRVDLAAFLNYHPTRFPPRRYPPFSSRNHHRLARALSVSPLLPALIPFLTRTSRTSCSACKAVCLCLYVWGPTGLSCLAVCIIMTVGFGSGRTGRFVYVCLLRNVHSLVEIFLRPARTNRPAASLALLLYSLYGS